MPDAPSSRTWNSICGDCTRYADSHCLAGYITDGETDCIAAICEGFIPKAAAKTAKAIEKGDD